MADRPNTVLIPPVLFHLVDARAIHKFAVAGLVPDVDLDLWMAFCHRDVVYSSPMVAWLEVSKLPVESVKY